jgi:hypothetical protein
MRRNHDYSPAQILAMLVVAIAITGAIIFFLAYREEKIVVIEDRWWEYSLKVQYDWTSCDAFTDAEGNISVSCDDDTFTRCRTRSAGRNLPPVRPEIPCRMRSGDYLNENVYYYASYRVEEGTERDIGHFHSHQWDGLAIGQRVWIKTDLMGNIKEYGDRNHGQ